MEADAEAIRAAILLDELETRLERPPKGKGPMGGGMAGPSVNPSEGRIIVEVKTLNALAVLQFSCSIRVMALHTGEMNARRCVACFADSTGHLLTAAKGSLLTAAKGCANSRVLS